MKNCLILFMLVWLPLSILFAQDNGQMKDGSAIKQTALDYAEGYYSGNGDRMKRAIHVDLNKVFAIKVPQAETILRHSTVSQLVGASRAKAG